MKFPLIEKNKSYYPDKAICPWCKENKVFEPHSFVHIGGGALLEYPDEDETFGSSEKMLVFFHVGWHGAHPEDGGVGKDPDTYVNLNIANDVEGGQFELYFCSTKCLREFLNSCVDKLEDEIKKQK